MEGNPYLNILLIETFYSFNYFPRRAVAHENIYIHTYVRITINNINFMKQAQAIQYTC